jgi:nicotinate-nucleotide adenylyltransferase
LRSELGPQRALYLILGADAFLRLPAWSRWLQLFELAHIAVALRPGYVLDEAVSGSSELQGQWRQRFNADPTASATAPAGAIVRIPIPLLEISASDLRARMSQGASVRYLLSPAVVDYIAAHHLYPSQ